MLRLFETMTTRSATEKIARVARQLRAHRAAPRIRRWRLAVGAAALFSLLLLVAAVVVVVVVVVVIEGES